MISTTQFLNTNMSKSNDFNLALQALEAANKINSIQVWVPSLGRNVEFTPITTGQQKAIIRSLVDNPVYQTNFILALYDIIKSNQRDATLDIDKLLISDKIAIAIQLRQNSVGDTVTVKVENRELKVWLTKVSFDKPTDEILATEVTDSGFTIKCTLPTISREAQLEKELRSKLTSSELSSYEDVRNVLADAYIGELAKHITCVKVGETEINVGVLNFSDAYNVIERLPATAVRGVVTYMENVQKYLATLRMFPALVDPSANAETVEITVDAAFFATK